MDHKPLYIESLCGDSIFWDYNFVWNSTSPKLTRCIHQTILNWLPTSFLWLFSIYELTRTARIRRKCIPWNLLNISRLLLSIICILLNTIQLFNITYGYFNSSNQPSPADFYAPLLNIASFTLLTLFLHYHRLRGVNTSAVIWIYSFLQTTSTFLICYQTWINSQEYSQFELILFNIYFVILAFLFVNLSFADGPTFQSENYELRMEKKHEQCKNSVSPEDEASFPNQLVFWWFNGMILSGWKKSLTFKDLWELGDDLKTENLVKQFDVTLQKPIPGKNNVFKDSPKPNGDFTRSSRKHNVNIVPALVKILGSYFIVGSSFKLAHDIAQFITPQLLGSLIDFIKYQADEPVWHGYLIALFMCIVAFGQTILLNQYFYRMQVTGFKICSILTTAIYKKSLNLGDKARKDVTSGEIVNLMSVDAKRFKELLPYLNLIWSAPFQIAVSMYFLYRELGYSSFFGLAVMVFMIPLNAVVVKLSQKFQVKFMKQKDERVKFMNEILNGIKIIKFYAWEKSFLSHVTELRRKELNFLRNVSYLECSSAFLWVCSPTMVSIATFAAYVLVQNEVLTAQKAFVSLSLFHILQFPLSMLPELISLYIMASVSIKRINKFLNSDELDPYVTRNDEIDAITIVDACFKWEKSEEKAKENDKHTFFKKNNKDCHTKEQKDSLQKSEQIALQKINMRVKIGSFVAIVGSVGSGKSTLLSAILGEMEKVEGRININGKLKIAYVAQQAWIQNASLRENILFGNAYDKAKYEQVISACALEPDIAYLPGGDVTEIGEKGINLSGGQKQRVSLARACYSDSDLILMDDPLSAVDAHVAKHIFSRVLSSKKGLLRNKTRILVTNKLDLLSKVDSIYVLTKGRISETGSYKELMESQGVFADLVQQYTNTTKKDELDEPLAESIEKKVKEGIKNVKEDDEDKKKILIETETSETGKVEWSVYLEYFGMISILWTLLIVVSQAASQGLTLSSDIWLSEWSSDSLHHNLTLSNTKMRLGVYSVLGFAKGIVTLFGSFALVAGTLRASTGFHSKLLLNIFRAPMSFFDTNPIGRIINRFSKDIDTLDTMLPQVINYWSMCLFEVVAAFIIISINTPLFIVALIPVSLFYAFIQHIYVGTSRQLRRLESVSRSPIYSHFGETLNGVSTIRAFGVTDRFIQESAQKVDINLSCYYPSIIANRWLSIRLELCGIIIVFCSALFAVLERKTLNPGAVGLSVSYALSITETLNWFVRMSSDFETNIVSVERILEYCGIPSEADWYEAKVKPEASWPDKGTIKFDKFEARYREGTELILKGISAEIKSKEKIGIVGRTGAGKSTVTLSLFRLIEPAGGSISIDGYNISDLPLHPLRSRLAIIPQDPVLFCGTLRFNLDPFDSYSDSEIYDALSHVHLKDFVTNTDEGLNFTISEEGKNLSVGQRQLICLARALLKKPKILFLDEATAAIDLETDALIQNTIRTEFKECTILTIAHRLNTILDSDRVIVLDGGKIAEFDNPETLLDKKDSIFYSLAKEANLVS